MLLAIYLLMVPKHIYIEAQSPPHQQLNVRIKDYLDSKNSPLAGETDLLLRQEHWKLLIAISAIESQFCLRQISWNCWGIGGDENYRHYESISLAVIDANNLIESWQQRGRWLTVEDMNGHYVVPVNPNWVNVVNKVLKELDGIITGTISTT